MYVLNEKEALNEDGAHCATLARCVESIQVRKALSRSVRNVDFISGGDGGFVSESRREDSSVISRARVANRGGELRVHPA